MEVGVFRLGLIPFQDPVSLLFVTALLIFICFRAMISLSFFFCNQNMSMVETNMTRAISLCTLLSAYSMRNCKSFDSVMLLASDFATNFLIVSFTSQYLKTRICPDSNHYFGSYYYHLFWDQLLCQTSRGSLWSTPGIFCFKGCKKARF